LPDPGVGLVVVPLTPAFLSAVVSGLRLAATLPTVAQELVHDPLKLIDHLLKLAGNTLQALQQAARLWHLAAPLSTAASDRR